MNLANDRLLLAFLQRAILENITKVLKAAGSGLEHMVKVNIYLTDMGNFAAMNEIYALVSSISVKLRISRQSTDRRVPAVLRQGRYACPGVSRFSLDIMSPD